MHIDLTVKDNLTEDIIIDLISEKINFVKSEGFNIQFISSSSKSLNLMIGTHKKYYLYKDAEIEYTLEIFYNEQLDYLKIFTSPI